MGLGRKFLCELQAMKVEIAIKHKLGLLRGILENAFPSRVGPFSFQYSTSGVFRELGGVGGPAYGGGCSAHTTTRTDVGASRAKKKGKGVGGGGANLCGQLKTNNVSVKMTYKSNHQYSKGLPPKLIDGCMGDKAPQKGAHHL